MWQEVAVMACTGEQQPDLGDAAPLPLQHVQQLAGALVKDAGVA